MGWFSCYGSREKEDKRVDESADKGHEHGNGIRSKRHQQQQLEQQQHQAANNRAVKYHGENFKTLVPVENVKVVVPVDDAHKETPTSGLQETIPDSPAAVQNIAAQTFTFKQLAVAAEYFREECLIGEGGFGSVYRGCLENGQVVAIKQLNRNGLQGNREFLVEVLMLSLLHHENLVNLIGYCADGDQRLLVYEFMPLGSLEDHLHDIPDYGESLNWMTRMKIAAGAARGLAFLHDTANPPVIYRDLKSSNILLDEDYHPKLSDFGLAKLGPVGDKTHVSTRVMGTYGYCAPEYAMTGQLTMKSDVYSFGVVLLELITGRKAIDQTRPSGEHNLVAWARPLFKDRRKFAQMADPKLHGQFPLRGLFQALAVAAMCLHEQAASRPAIADVVTALNFLASQTSEASPVPTKGCLTAPASAASKSEDGSVHAQYTVDSNDGAHTDTNGHGETDKNGTTTSDKNDISEGELQTPSARPVWKTQIKGKDREQAVAEARSWGEAWREKRGGSRREGEEKPSQTS